MTKRKRHESSRLQAKCEFNSKQDPTIDSSNVLLWTTAARRLCVLKILPLCRRKNNGFCRGLQIHSSSPGLYEGILIKWCCFTNINNEKHVWKFATYRQQNAKAVASNCWINQTNPQPSGWLHVKPYVLQFLSEQPITLLCKSIGFILKLWISPQVGTESRFVLWQIHLAIVNPHEQSNE